MKALLLFEGTDGSGKTTLINSLISHLNNGENSCQIICKDDIEPAKEITQIYQKRQVDELTEIYLRIAREFAKIEAIDYTKDFVIVDRAIVSLVSTIQIYNFATNEFKQAIEQIVNGYSNFYTIFCIPPFEVARKRIEKRVITEGKSLSKKELKGFEYNRKIYEMLESLAQDASITGKEILGVDTHLNTEDECLNLVVDFLKERRFL